eukprot:Nitzschia sp. Nitz4//scaffold392_size11901//3792//4259//NITZ4_009019-RA/size11901-processed-gene-0.6-mRNA-1//-1//CDS//3329550213//6617//frame0
MSSNPKTSDDMDTNPSGSTEATSASTDDHSANQWKLPYYAVVFTSVLTQAGKGSGPGSYEEMGGRMVELAKQQDGFLGIEGTRNAETGLGITVSYWRDMESIRAWKANTEHCFAQKMGREGWYQRYRLSVTKVVKDYSFEAPITALEEEDDDNNL